MKTSIETQLEDLSKNIDLMEANLIEAKKVLRYLLKRKSKMVQMEEMLQVLKDMEKAL